MFRSAGLLQVVLSYKLIAHSRFTETPVTVIIRFVGWLLLVMLAVCPCAPSSTGISVGVGVGASGVGVGVGGSWAWTFGDSAHATTSAANAAIAINALIIGSPLMRFRYFNPAMERHISARRLRRRFAVKRLVRSEIVVA